MKKTASALLVVILVASCLGLVACSDEPAPETYTVSFYIGTTCIDVISVKEGDVIGEYTVNFGNYKKDPGAFSWYTTKTGDIEWNIYKDTVQCNMSLFGRVNEL